MAISDAANIAINRGLSPDLVEAIIQVESNGNVFAYRVEPPYRYLVDVNTGKPFRRLTSAEGKSERAPKDFPYFPRVSSRDTEWLGQQASWGPMQIMGAVARELGFNGAFPELCGPVGVLYGCKHLANLHKRFYQAHGIRGVIAAYNAGRPRVTVNAQGYRVFRNQGYVDKVWRNLQNAAGLRETINEEVG